MPKIILKFLYNRYKNEFYNLLVEDLLMNIPNKVGKPAIEIVGAKKDTVTKWLYFEANSIARRSITDFPSIERRNGMLIAIQAFIIALSNPLFKEEKIPEVKAKSDVPVESYLSGIDSFKRGMAVDK